MRALWRGGKSPSLQPLSPASRRWLSPVISAVLLTLVLTIWTIAAPTQFGGPVSYVVVTGNSMEPGLHDGDLAIVRQADRYQPGDIVAYRHPDIGPVIHRIQVLENGRFVFQGDNNSWVDSYNPDASELIGALWLQAPRIGALMEAARSTGALPILGGVGGAIMMVNFLSSGEKAQKNRRRRRTVRPITGGPIGENAQSVLAALGIALAGFSALGIFSFAQPVDRAVQKEARYEQSGSFSYSASVPSAAVYDADTVTTGEPVFRRLANEVDVAFAYRFASMSPSDVSGTQRLVALVTDTNGWRRTLPLTESASFEGNAFNVRGTLDLDRVQALIDSLESDAGVKRDHHEVFIVPEVRATGVVAGQPFTEPFEPRLGFRFDSYQLQMLPPGPKETDPRSPSQSSAVQVPQIEANTLSVMGARLNVSDARRLALLGVTLCMAAGLAFGFYLLRDRGADEPSRIEARLRSMLVAVRSDGQVSGRIMDVESIDDLGRLAERVGVVVLHEVTGNVHRYFVQDGELTYRYESFARRAGAIVGAPETAGR